MEKLYSDKRNRFIHDDFNRLRFRLDKSKNIAIKEAVEILLDFTDPIVIDTSASQQRGERRYLESCLLQNGGALRLVKTDGFKFRCEFEKDTSKYAARLPFLAAMMQEVQELSATSRINLLEWLSKYRKPPYGQGPVALSLALACIRRNFGDSILIKPDETAIIPMTLKDFDTVVNLVEGYSPQAFLTYRPLRPEERTLANRVFAIFGLANSAAEAAQDVTLQEAYSALLTWWQGLPPLARAVQLYTTAPSHQTSFINAMEAIAAKDPHSFLLDDLPAAFGAAPGMAVTQDVVDLLAAELPQFKTDLEGALQRVEARIIDAVRQLFGVQQQAYSSIIDGIAAWYDGLDSHQRDPHAPWHNNDSKPLTIYMKTLKDLNETFMERIPASPDYGLKRVPDWITDHVDEYTERLRRGKQRIEDHKLKVDAPELEFQGKYEREDATVSFSDRLVLTLKAKKPGDRIYITQGYADPTDPSSQRLEYTGEAQLSIQDRTSIKYVACDADGNWGVVETLELVNEAKKYEINVQESFKKGPNASFVFPTDVDSFNASLRSLLRIALKRKTINRDDAEYMLKIIIDDLKKDDI
jgi:hypothetical protein